MTRNRNLLLVVALLLIAGLTWYWIRSTPSVPLPPPLDTTTTETGTSATRTDVINETSVDSERTAVTEPETETERSTDNVTDTVTLRGRCVQTGDEQPIAGCLAATRIESGAAAAAVPWTNSPIAASTSSAIDGTFELTPAYDAWTDTVALRLSAGGFVPRVGHWPRPEPGTTIDLGDVPMVRAITVTGIVVDEENAPVANAGMMFVNIVLTSGHQVATENMLRARSDATGRFAFDLPAYPGEWYIGAEDTGALVAPRSVKLTAEQSTFELRVTVERPDPQHSITGIVVDAANQPLPEVRITATGEGFIGRGRSGNDGRFTVQRAGPVRDDGKRGTLLNCSDADRMYERTQPALDERIAWGTDGVEIVMRRLASRTVRVVDARGQPVTQYTLFAFAGHRQLRRYSRLTSRAVHPDGRCQLPGLQSGNNSLVVVPRDPRLASTEVITFVVDPASIQDELLVTIRDSVPMSVTVTGTDGRAMTTSRLQLLQNFVPEQPTTTSAAVDLLDCDRSRAVPGHVIIAEATTGSDGSASFAAPPGSWTLRVFGEEHVPLVQAAEVFPPESRLAVTVQAASVLQGQLQPAEALHALQGLARGGDEPIAVVVTPTAGDALPAVAVDPDGHYRVGGLLPGEYSVSLRYWLRVGEVHSDSVIVPITTVTVLGGQRRDLAIDVSTMLPGTVHGRVIAGGEPLRDVHCFLRPEGPGRNRGLRVATDGEGRFRGLVPPGEYGFAITYPVQPGPGWLHMVLPGSWHLTSGETHEVNFDVPLRRVRVRVLDAAGEPAADLPVKVVRKGYFIPGGLKTDATGWVEIYPAPFDAFFLQADVAGERQRLGPVDLPSGQTRGEVTVRAG